MARQHALPARVFARLCLLLPAFGATLEDVRHGHEAVSIDADAVSLMQTFTAAKSSRHTSKLGVHKVSTQLFTSVRVPYKEYAFDRREVSDLPEHLSAGQLLAYDPKEAKNDDIFVFLPGSWVDCANYTELIETVGKSMKTLCLPYDNVKAMGEICAADDPECWMVTRVQANVGHFDDVDGNNIVKRLQSALEYMRDKVDKSWGAYLAGPSELNYKKMRVSGHSQGAGAAAMLAYENEVARVVQFSGPCDPADGRHEWTKVLHSETPSSRFFGLASWYDRFCDWESRQVPNWYHEGIIDEKDHPPALVDEKNLTSYNPAKAQTIISHIKSPVCTLDPMCLRDSHDSTALNKWEHGSPYAKDGVWQKLVGI